MEYSKEHQVRAGTKEAKDLLKRAFGRNRHQAEKTDTNPKYRNKKTQGVGGRNYDSKLEAAYAEHLEELKLAKEILDWKPQVCLKLYVNGEKICNYFMDFVVTHNDGRLELVEVKGFPTPEWKKKWNLTRALLPTGEIDGIPKDSRLTLVKKGTKKGFHSEPQLLKYT